MITATEAPVVTIAPGRVRGFWRGTPGTPGASAAFLGIPFAKAPVGDLRFGAPVPPEPWDDIRDAVEYGATAQRGDKGITLIPEPSIPGDSTLNVNVFTPVPGDAEAALPVLVYIHGGGYTAGSPASPWYDGRAFNRDGVVTVSVSYRLGFDGFGHIPGAPSNRGVRDWLAALEWVRENIAAFGGDPARVTIAGQSAGGGAVLTLLGMPVAQDLFHAVWALSGALGDVSPERQRTLSARLANLAGVAPTRDGFASVPEDTLLELQEKAGATDGDPMAGDHVAARRRAALGTRDRRRPHLAVHARVAARRRRRRQAARARRDRRRVHDGDGWREEQAALRAGIHRLPQARRLDRDPQGVSRRQQRSALEGHRRGARPLHDRPRCSAPPWCAIADIRATAGADANTWAYGFSWVSPKMGWAVHCLDVPFWFDCLDDPGVTAIAGEAPPRALAEAVHGAATAFVRDGDPGWTPWTLATKTGRIFGGSPSTPEVVSDAFASVYPLL